MRRTWIVVVATVFVAPGADAQERRPFHIAKFADDRTVSLAIASATIPTDRRYDFEVDVDLTERASDGDIIFADHGAHAVRVRCQSPKAVQVGGIVHPLPQPLKPKGWMQDLWEVLCLQPTS